MRKTKSVDKADQKTIVNLGPPMVAKGQGCHLAQVKGI